MMLCCYTVQCTTWLNILKVYLQYCAKLYPPIHLGWVDFWNWELFWNQESWNRGMKWNGMELCRIEMEWQNLLELL